MMISFPPSTPQIFALLFLATIAALIAELFVRNAPPFGFVGGLLLGVIGVFIFTLLPGPNISFEPRLEDIPAIRAVLGGFLIVAFFCFIRKRQSV